MRGLLFFVTILALYYVLKTILKSALKTYREDVSRNQIKGEEMILDPQCHTYVIKDRAVTRRIQGTLHSFCSEECARRYEDSRHA